MPCRASVKFPAAVLAQVVGIGIVVAALIAEFRVGLACGESARGGSQRLHLELGALMIDEVVGSKLAEGQETRAADELSLAARDIGAQGKPGKVVSGQEAFAGQIAIRIEVRLGE